MTLIVKLYQRFLSNGDYSNNFWRKKEVICSWLSRCSTARGPDPWYNWGGLAKVGARKGPFINDVTQVEGRGVSDFVTLCMKV